MDAPLGHTGQEKLGFANPHNNLNPPPRGPRGFQNCFVRRLFGKLEQKVFFFFSKMSKNANFKA